MTTAPTLRPGLLCRFAPQDDQLAARLAPELKPGALVRVAQRTLHSTSSLGVHHVDHNGRPAGVVLAASLQPLTQLQHGANTFFDYRGKRFLFTTKVDLDQGPPWQVNDGHGPVSEWTRRAKRPGERVLVADIGGSKRFYGVQEATKTARRDGWDAEPFGTGTPGQRAARAVEADFQRLKDWCDSRWYYIGVTITLIDGQDDEPDKAVLWGVNCSLWGIESDSGNDYITEVGYQLADDLIAANS